MKTPTEDGVYPGLDRETYERIPRVNWSTLKHMQRSPLHYRAALQETFKDTDPMRVGRATHSFALEPETFFSRWAVWDGDRRAGKEWEKFKEKTAGLEILTAKQFDAVKAMATAALTNEHAAKYLRGGSMEVTVLWTHQGTGLQCKSRLDHAHPEMGVLVDLKTTADASAEAFGRLSWNLDYGGQAAFYTDAWEAVTSQRLPYILVAVETGSPYAVQPYYLPELAVENGRALYERLLERVALCRKENRWPGYGEGVIQLEAPRWAQTQENQDLSGLGLEFEEEQPAHA